MFNIPFNKKYFLYLIISLILSYFLVNLSASKESWYTFWNLLNVPKMWPAFADIDFIHRSLVCKFKGYDPTVYNPCDINNTRYQYPIVWLSIFEYLKLDSFKNFKIFVFFSIFLLFISYFVLLEISKKKFNKIILILLFFSSSSTLLIERGNIDHIIFILSMATLLSRNYFYETFVIFINSCLKIYPFFAFFYLIKNNKKLLLTFLIMLLTIIFVYEVSISKYLNPNHSFMAITQAYGVQSITEGLFKTLEKKYLYFLDIDTKNIIRLFAIIVFIILCFSVFLFGTKSRDENILINYNQEKLFIIGASIYVGSYIFFSNIDYRLIFLFLTIPYIENIKPKINYVYCILVLIISNSWLFRLEPLTFSHIIFTTFIYAIKFIILIFLCYNLGKISKNVFQDIGNIKILK